MLIQSKESASVYPKEPTNNYMSDGFSSANDNTDDEESLNMTEDEYMTEEDHRDKIWMRGMSSLISKSSFTLQNALALNNMNIKIYYVGPNYRGPGGRSFDKQCIFANMVEMNFKQMMQLEAVVDISTRPSAKPSHSVY